MPFVSAPRFVILLFSVVGLLFGQPVPVRYTEGRVRGFLVLRDVQNNILAAGDISQTTSGNRVTTVLSFHFKDGSLYEETTVMSQRRTFQLVSYRLVQKGPTFKRSMDVSLNGATGQFTNRYTDEDGKEKTISERLKLPDNVANGFITTALCNIDPKTPKTVLSMVVATPKPRIVNLDITPVGEDSFSVGGSPRKALHYNIKIKIGGISGVIAPIVGKQPPDTEVWIIGGKVPGLVRSEGALFEDGPIWRIELASPVWPKATDQRKGPTQ